jgi:hypothetical protein
MRSLAALHDAVTSPVALTAEGEKAGPIGLAVILLLIVACTFLFKSMSKHLRKVRDEFPVPPRSATGSARGAAAADRAAAEGVVPDAVVPDSIVPTVEPEPGPGATAGQ